MIRLIGLGILMTPCIWMDVKRRELPVGFILIFSALALAANLIFGWIEGGDLLLGAVLGGMFLLAACLTRKGLGMGDGFLILGVGIFCGGQFTVPLLLFTFLLTLILGGAWLLLRGRRLNERLPLAPFMGLAGLLQCLLFLFLPEGSYGTL